MRRIVGGLTGLRRAAIGRVPALFALAIGPMATAGDGDGPEPLPPVGSSIVSKPLNPPAAPAAEPARSPRGRAVLAIPGMTTRAVRPALPLEGPKPIAEPGAAPEPAELSLDGPIEMKPLPDPLPGRSGAGGSRSTLPLILESSTMDDLGPLGGSSAREGSASKKPSERAQPVPMPARRSRLFGFLGGPAASRSPVITPAPGRSASGEEPEDDEAALRRRIERQARDAVGNRARSVEVRVEGKSAVVHASGVKLFQKRAVRKQIEGIPALAGLRSTIEVGD